MGDRANLTVLEHAVISDLGKLANDFSDIIGDGPTSKADFLEAVIHIHALQRMVMSNAAARAYPLLYRRLGEVIDG